MLRASHILLAGEEEAVRVREEILAAGGGREAFAAAGRRYPGASGKFRKLAERTRPSLVILS
mgnify:CR=1 FL=1